MADMDRELLKRRIEALTEQVLDAWDMCDGAAVPTLRARYGDFIVVIGVEYATEQGDSAETDLQDQIDRLDSMRQSLDRFAKQ